MELLQPTIEYIGPAARHNFPCPVCLVKPAVLYMNEGIFLPCRECQSNHWALKRTDWWNNSQFQNCVHVIGCIMAIIIAATSLKDFIVDENLWAAASFACSFVFLIHALIFFKWLEDKSKKGSSTEKVVP